MNRQWTSEEAWSWYKARPWITGCNYLPGETMNDMEFWQEYNHEQVFRQVGKELALASSIGFNSLRIWLPFHIWQLDREVFYRHVDEFLDLCDRYHITIMPVLFNDCCVSKERYQPELPGKQPEPVPGYFGGTPVTSFDGNRQVGWLPTDEPELKPVMEEYVRALARRYGNDPRVLIWNVWNEPGNSNRLSKSMQDMENVFCWLREEDVSQPLTADVWGGGIEHPYEYLRNPGVYTEIERRAAELSDIVSFHYYGDYVHTVRYIDILKGYGRPLINDEWLHRPQRCFIQTHLPLFKEEGIGSYMFGFVNGKRQFDVVWESLKGRPDMDTELWMHDIFLSNFLPYDERELAVIRKANLES